MIRLFGSDLKYTFIELIFVICHKKILQAKLLLVRQSIQTIKLKKLKYTDLSDVTLSIKKKESFRNLIQTTKRNIKKLCFRNNFPSDGDVTYKVRCFIISPFLKLKMLGVSSGRISVTIEKRQKNFFDQTIF